MTRDPARVRGILWATEAKVTLGRRRQHTIEFDEIGEWSERKIEYVRKYVDAYSRILQRQKFHSTYIDAFAGAGVHRRKGTGELVPGSPMQVLDVTPPFDEYHFIDLDVSKLDYLKEQVGERPDVHFHAGDCNEILVSEVFPQIRYKDYRRAFCLLDPYGLHLRWEVFHEAARTGTVEILVNFSIMDLNMNVGLKNPAGIKPEQAERMTAFWGDETWREAVHALNQTQPNLFGLEEKAPNDAIAKAFCQRLKDGAGFAYVAPPRLMSSTSGAPLYYLVFASHNATGAKIMGEILRG